MPGAMTLEDAIAEAVTLTRLSPREVSDLASLSPDQLRLAIASYADQDWTQPGDPIAKVLALFAIIGAAAGAISGVAGAASAVAALRTA